MTETAKERADRTMAEYDDLPADLRAWVGETNALVQAKARAVMRDEFGKPAARPAEGGLVRKSRRR